MVPKFAKKFILYAVRALFMFLILRLLFLPPQFARLRFEIEIMTVVLRHRTTAQVEKLEEKREGEKIQRAFLTQVGEAS